MKMPKIARFLNLMATLFEDQDRLKKIPYAQYLQTTHWQQLRYIKLQEADNRCQVCYSPQSLHVHHRTYERLGHEKLTDLTVLCKECHQLFHANRTLDKPTKKKYTRRKKGVKR